MFPLKCVNRWHKYETETECWYEVSYHLKSSPALPTRGTTSCHSLLPSPAVRASGCLSAAPLLLTQAPLDPRGSPNKSGHGTVALPYFLTSLPHTPQACRHRTSWKCIVGGGKMTAFISDLLTIFLKLWTWAISLTHKNTKYHSNSKSDSLQTLLYYGNSVNHQVRGGGTILPSSFIWCSKSSRV